MSTVTAETLKRQQPVADAPATIRKPLNRDVPLEWIDNVLVAVSELDPASSLDQRASALAAAAVKSLPNCAVGVCILDRAGALVLVRQSPRARHTPPHDPVRLFPEFTCERTVSIELAAQSTLHIASDDPEFLESAPLEGFVDRLLLALQSTIRDAHAHEALRAQVIQAEKLASLGQIAAGIVHELNNPLTSILAYSEYLHRKGERTGVDASDLERIKRINEAADRILRFSRDLIAYSRPSTEKPDAVSLHEIIERALIFCEHVLDQTGVNVEKCFGELRPVLGVTGPLTQVFVNLFTNAAHAMHQHGGCLSITTSMSHNDGHVMVTIQDEGHGIDREHLPRIFDPFFTTKTDGTGTGLGLSIVRSIVATHGGQVRACAREPRGTIFYVDLPIIGQGSMGP